VERRTREILALKDQLAVVSEPIGKNVLAQMVPAVRIIEGKAETVFET
jgi:hypothetical protein